MMMLNDDDAEWQCWITMMLNDNDAEWRWGWTMMMLLTSVYYSYCDRLLSWRHAVIMSYHKARVPWRQGTRVLLSWLSTATLIEFNHCITLNSKYVCLYANYHFCCRCCCFIPFTYHTEISSPWKSAGLPDWRWFTVWTNETFSLLGRLLKKKWQGGGKLKTF